MRKRRSMVAKWTNWNWKRGRLLNLFCNINAIDALKNESHEVKGRSVSLHAAIVFSSALLTEATTIIGMNKRLTEFVHWIAFNSEYAGVCGRTLVFCYRRYFLFCPFLLSVLPRTSARLSIVKVLDKWIFKWMPIIEAVFFSTPNADDDDDGTNVEMFKWLINARHQAKCIRTRTV